MGNGVFSKSLSYKDWYIFNNWQRIHHNFLEQLVPILLWIAVGSFYMPLESAICGFTYFIGRIFFSIGYAMSPNKRVVGAIICDIGYLAAFGIAVYTCLNANLFKSESKIFVT